MAGNIALQIFTSQWESQLLKISEKIKSKFTQSVYTSSELLLQKIKEYTPIGDPNIWNPPYWPKNYVPGTLKASWERSIEGATITISNPQPYAYRVEHGWSKQAPEGMMRRALIEYPELVKRTYGITKL